MAYFTIYDTFICILSLLTYLADAFTDVLLIVFFFIEGHAIWGSMSLCFVAVATLFMQIFSFHWHVTDKSLTWKEFIIHILFLAPLHRYVEVLRLGLRSRKTGRQEDLDAAYRGLNDVSILRLFETFLESAPQLVLQLYIIASDITHVDPLVGVSCLFSLLSVSWAVTAYTDALHLAYKKLYKRSTLSLLTHTIWQTGMITSRVCAVVLFATVFKGLVAIPLGLHALAMVVWIATIKPDFGNNACEKGLFMMVAAVIHTFCFFNLKDGKSRWRMLFYYTVCFVENTVLVCLWYSFNDTDQPSWLDPVGFSAVFGGFTVGVVSMFMYYCCCHPSGPAPLTAEQKPTFQRSQSFNHGEGLVHHKQPIFNVSSSSADMIKMWLHASQSLDLSKEGLTQNPDNYLDTNLHTSYEGQGDGIPYGYHGNNQFESISARSRDLTLDEGGKPVGNTSQTDGRNRSRTLNSTDYGSNMSNSGQEQYSLPSYNIIEMFSRCKNDSAFSSTLSLNRSGNKTGNNESNYYPSSFHGRTQDAFRHQDPHSANSAMDKHRKNSNPLRDYKNTSPALEESMEYSPIQISPLDPYKLLEDSQYRQLYYSKENLIGSDGAISVLESTPILSVQPDTSRGITRLSLSYTRLNSDENLSPQQLESKCYKHSPDGPSTLLPSHKERSPLYTNKSLRKSDELTFSNLSLPLPDDSLQSRIGRSRDHMDYYPSHMSLNRDFSNTNPRPAGRKISPLSTVIKNRSADSFYTNSPLGKQLSYQSDQGLSSSDHVLSISDCTTNRSHRSLTSSGFQSEESNYSSPGNMHAHYRVTNQFQSTPILENEIATIQDVPLSGSIKKRVSLDTDVDRIPATQEDNLTPVLPHDDRTNSLRDKRRPFPSALMYSESLEQIESPTLPPLIVSSRLSSGGSGNSGRFFRDLSVYDNQSDEMSDSSGAFSQSDSSGSRKRYSTNNEKSSISAYLSDRSTTGNIHSSDETISVSDSDNQNSRRVNSVNIESKRLPKKSDSQIQLYENTAGLSQSEGRGKMVDMPAHSLAGSPVYANATTTKRYSTEPNRKSIPGQGKDESHFEHGPSIIEELENSPNRFGKNAELFNGEKWRASLDKEARERLVNDIEKFAPKKLYQLRAKSDNNSKKRLSPVAITDYNDSPYKFRRSTDRQSDYVNIDNVSPASLSSADEHIHSLTPHVYTDYENVYNLCSLKTGNCPIVRPESLSDAMLLDDHGVGRMDTVVSEPCRSYISTVRSPISLETSESQSPINTSGINSAFKPVKPRSTDSERGISNSSGNASVFDDSSSFTSGSNIQSKQDSPLGGDRPSETFTVKNSQEFPYEETSVDSVNPWSYMSDSRAQSFDITGQTPRNYLKLAGRASLSFSVSSLPLDDRSSRCSGHSYTNSIPWEDPENISCSFQTTQDKVGVSRPPLRSLENTPVFSPIYGQDSKVAPESTNRKRFMSTPKLSTGLDNRLSKTPTGSAINANTPLKRSSFSKNKTFTEDTSTWSTYSGQDWSLETNEKSSLSKTTYI